METPTAARRSTTIDDLARFAIPMDPRISPEGTRIAYVLKTTDLEKNKYHTHIWVVGTDVDPGSPPTPRQWTRSPESESQPRWSPDGKWLLFTSGREEKQGQIFRIPTDGGEAEKLTKLPPGAIGDVQWSPDGTQVAFTFRPQDEEWREAAGEERKKNNRSNPPREITRRHYRSEGSGFTPKASFQINLLNVETGAVAEITGGDRDIHSFCWSPDGRQIAFVRNVAPSPDLKPNDVAIFVQPARSLTEDETPRPLNAPAGPKSSLRWSPDGKHIAYFGHEDENEVWGLTNSHPWVVSLAEEGSARDLAPGWDFAVGSLAIGDMAGSGDAGPFWSPNSGGLMFLASDRGRVQVYEVALSGDATPLAVTEGDWGVTGASLSADGEALALLIAEPTDAGDVYIVTADTGNPWRVTQTNRDLLAEIDLPQPVYFEAPTSEGHTVPCWACLPPGDVPGPHPTILYIHGGPHLMYAHTLFHEYQALAAAGFVVLYPNPRGSKGYGEAWTAGIKGNWGEPAQADCLACVDYAIAQGWSEAANLGVAGGSYGGYLTGWIIGHSDRFQAAVAERGVYNLHSMAGTCDFVWRDHDYFDADTTGDPGDYLRNSPLTYVDDVTAKTLIIHSEGDLRCPIEQSEQFFNAMLLKGKDAVFLRYGSESNHDLSRGGPPDLRLDRQRRIHAWFEKHLKKRVQSDS